jgi:hypothetical protein
MCPTAPGTEFSDPAGQYPCAASVYRIPAAAISVPAGQPAIPDDAFRVGGLLYDSSGQWSWHSDCYDNAIVVTIGNEVGENALN